MEMTEKNSLSVVSIRMVHDAPLFSEHEIITPEDAIDVVGEYLCDMDREIVAVINLKADCTPINVNFASIGTINSSIINPGEIFKTAILSNAAIIIIIHNHPSGNLTPSLQDIKMTDKMIQCCELMEIPLLDHIIVGGDNEKYFSFRNNGLMDSPNMEKTDLEIDNLKFQDINSLPVKKKIR